MNQVSVDSLVPLVRKRIGELKLFAENLRKQIKKVPAGRLRVTRSNGCVQYYRVDKTPPGEFIRSEHFADVKALAQKAYDIKTLQVVLSQKACLEKFEKRYVSLDLADVYESLKPERKKLLMSHFLSDESFARQWSSEIYEGLPFNEGDSELVTSEGVRVRSKSEVIIADVLDRLKIPYHYERPVKMNDGIVVYPDFSCLNVRNRKEILWEHFGLLDKPEYVENFVLKLRTYSRNGYVMGDNLIFTTENKKIPLSPSAVEILARTHLC